MEVKKSKLLTRKEIIDLWMKQPEELLNILSCPNCRDLLFKTIDKENLYEYFCKSCDIMYERI
jgi:hypothetical protein